MSHPAYATITVLAISGVCFGSFAWAIKTHFVMSERMPSGMLVISVASFLGMGTFLVTGILFPNTSWIPLPILLTSLGIFIWAVLETRKDRLTVAFSEDRPGHLITRGPYRFVRHPFYLSYMLFWLAGAMATSSLLPWLVFVLMAGIYVFAARTEERKFCVSELQDEYREYVAATGMFFPRVRFLWKSFGCAVSGQT